MWTLIISFSGFQYNGSSIESSQLKSSDNINTFNILLLHLYYYNINNIYGNRQHFLLIFRYVCVCFFPPPSTNGFILGIYFFFGTSHIFIGYLVNTPISAAVDVSFGLNLGLWLSTDIHVNILDSIHFVGVFHNQDVWTRLRDVQHQPQLEKGRSGVTI